MGGGAVMDAIGAKALLNGLPHSRSAEGFVVGSLLLAGRLLPEAESLKPADFFLEKHRMVFTVARILDGLAKPIDVQTVFQLLEDRGEANRCGGLAGVCALTEGLPRLENISAYVETVQEKARLRRLSQAASAAGQAALDGGAEAERIIEQLQAELDQIAAGDSRGPQRFTLEAIDREFAAFAANIDTARLRLGLDKFDDATGGVAPGEVLTVLARTGVGKSAIAQNVLQHVLDSDPDAGAIFYSLEMPRVLAWQRQLQIRFRVRGDEVIASYRGVSSRADADAVLEKLSGRLLIVDDPTMDLAAIKRFTRSAQAARLVAPVRIIALDYLSLLDRGGRENLTARTSLLARGVKEAARELDVVVLLIVQASRSAGDGSEPVTLTDARDSGAIEEAADFLIGAWRPDMVSAADPDALARDPEIAFRLLKSRRGPKPQWRMRFDGPTLKVG